MLVSLISLVLIYISSIFLKNSRFSSKGGIKHITQTPLSTYLNALLSNGLLISLKILHIFPCRSCSEIKKSKSLEMILQIEVVDNFLIIFSQTILVLKKGNKMQSFVMKVLLKIYCSIFFNLEELLFLCFFSISVKNNNKFILFIF